MADVRAYGKSLLIFLGFAALLARTTEGVRPQRSALPAGAAHTPACVRSAGPGTRSRILRADWWPIIKRAASGFLDDRIMAEAAAVTFYAMLALFPALASLISIYGLIHDPSQLSDQLQALDSILPGGGRDIIKAQVLALTASGHQALGLGLVVGLATSLWSANAGVKAFFDALNVVYRRRETRDYLRLTLISFTFTLGIIALLLLALVAVVVIPIALDFVGLGTETKALINVARWPAMLVLIVAMLAPVYRYGPNRPGTQMRWVTWGSAFAAVSWIAVSLAFSFYVANFGRYNKTYGSLGAAVGFMTWIWISVMVVLMGAELNAEIEGYQEGPGGSQSALG